MTDEALLNPDKSPSTLKKEPVIKRINNVPLFIFVGVVAVIALVFLYIVFSRAADQKAASQAGTGDNSMVVEGRVNTSSARTAQELADRIPDGIMESDIVEPEPVIENSGEESGGTASKEDGSSLVDMSLDDLTDNEQQEQGGGPVATESRGLSAPGAQQRLNRSTLGEREIDKIEQLKRQRLENAVYSGTAIDISSAGSHADIVSSAQQSASRLQQTLDQERQRLLQAQEAAVAANSGAGGSGLAGLGSALGFGPGAGSGSTGRLGGGGSGAGGGFMDDGQSDWDLGSQRQAGTRFTVSTGTVIPAILVNGINSELPGMVLGQVRQNVYDSATGEHLLIPQGTRLVGQYNSDVNLGQSRVMLRWDRLLFPDGSTLDLSGMPGADQMGFAGFSDKVNNHLKQIFGGAFLLSGISAGTQIALPNDSGDNDSRSATDDIALALSQQFGQTGSELVRRQMDIQPTIEIRPGYRFNVVVNKDMRFPGPFEYMSLR